MHVVFFERMQFVPEGEAARDDQSDEKANQKEPAVRGESNQENRYYCDRDDETRRSPWAESKPAARFRFHEYILAPFSGLAWGPSAADGVASREF